MNAAFSRTLIALTLCIGLPFAQTATAKEDFKICWSIYVGWMPWEYGDTSGALALLATHPSHGERENLFAAAGSAGGAAMSAADWQARVDHRSRIYESARSCCTTLGAQLGRGSRSATAATSLPRLL